MNLSRLIPVRSVKNILLSRVPCQACIAPLQARNYARKPMIDPDDAPIKFSSSGAIHGIADVRRIELDRTPWYQGFVVIGSVSVFLIYFCVLREENDIDLELDKSLYDRVGGLEIINLRIARKIYKERNNLVEVSKIDARLKELGVDPVVT